jgi:hypothetical protein
MNHHSVDVLTFSSGGRPEAMALCKRWFNQQDYDGKILHIIAEGGNVFTNLQKCVEASTADFCVIFEDDDYYKPHWVRTCADYLTRHQLVAQDTTRLYHVPTGGYEEHHVSQGGFHAIAFRGELRDKLIRVCQRAVWNDRGPEIERPFWEACSSLNRALIPGNHVVSMKGMPGTPGYSKKHDPAWFKKHDIGHLVLRDWVGADAVHYEALCTQH